MKRLIIDEINKTPETPGVYWIFAFRANKAIEISRFAGVDKSGLLFIGRTEKQTLKKRLYQFFASSKSDMTTHNHSGGNKYCKNPIIRKTLGHKHELYFQYEETESAKTKENKLQIQYFM